MNAYNPWYGSIDKEILNKLSHKVKIIFVSSLINAVGIETETFDEISEIKKLDSVKNASISEKADILLKDAINDIGALDVMRQNYLGFGVTISVIDSGIYLTVKCRHLIQRRRVALDTPLSSLKRVKSALPDARTAIIGKPDPCKSSANGI